MPCHLETLSKKLVQRWGAAANVGSRQVHVPRTSGGPIPCFKELSALRKAVLKWNGGAGKAPIGAEICGPWNRTDICDRQVLMAICIAIRCLGFSDQLAFQSTNVKLQKPSWAMK